MAIDKPELVYEATACHRIIDWQSQDTSADVEYSTELIIQSRHSDTRGRQ